MYTSSITGFFLVIFGTFLGHQHPISNNDYIVSARYTSISLIMCSMYIYYILGIYIKHRHWRSFRFNSETNIFVLQYKSLRFFFFGKFSQQSKGSNNKIVNRTLLSEIINVYYYSVHEITRCNIRLGTY